LGAERSGDETEYGKERESHRGVPGKVSGARTVKFR
jgi:hypothetical protein